MAGRRRGCWLSLSISLERMATGGVKRSKNKFRCCYGNRGRSLYVAAAKAAHHPKPHQQAQFLGPSNPLLPAFSLDDPAKVHELLLYNFRASGKPAEETENINVLGPWDYSYVMRMVDDFWNQHNRAVRMAKSAIDMYSQQHVVPKYELHVVCGVNEFVDGPFTPFRGKYRCSHINFLATQTLGTPPELFFAECRNDGSRVELCCPVAVPLPGTEQVRCLYCEIVGNRIVHPAAAMEEEERFRGRVIEFEKMLGGEEVYSVNHTNVERPCGWIIWRRRRSTAITSAKVIKSKRSSRGMTCGKHLRAWPHRRSKFVVEANLLCLSE